ncbi:hypothetical protein Ahy_A08g040836 [Arachis hypogaea]|uniref:Vitamin K epoxide reductase domain-containing protein n=1 Tax=Arachis hypogaea TaxID=3818 RepID=A0A445C0Q6_ARAHY|nr:hypothetical protein Ahy_A08g040836 [Arachis hypogaea]
MYSELSRTPISLMPAVSSSFHFAAALMEMGYPFRSPNHRCLGLFQHNVADKLPPPLKCSAAELDQETKVPATSSGSAKWTQKLKLTGSEAFCRIGGSPCGDILNSDYAFAFGNVFERMSLVGMVAYGLVVALGLQLATKKMLPFGID